MNYIIRLLQIAILIISFNLIMNDCSDIGQDCSSRNVGPDEESPDGADICCMIQGEDVSGRVGIIRASCYAMNSKDLSGK